MADISSKSAQYCASGMSGGTGLLLLVEAELGKPMYEIPTGDSGAEAEAKKRGCHSTLGVGRQAPQGWTDAQFINENLKGVQVVSLPHFPDPGLCILLVLMYHAFFPAGRLQRVRRQQSGEPDRLSYAQRVHRLFCEPIADQVPLPRGHVDGESTASTFQTTCLALLLLLKPKVLPFKA